VEISELDAFECVSTKLDIREFDRKPIPFDLKVKVLEAARLTGSGINVQHWRFIIVQDRENLRKLAMDSTSGKWVDGASFAVIVLTAPKYGFHVIDAGRVAQDMQLAAWNYGVASCLFTGVNQSALAKDFKIPGDLTASVVIGFGYPTTELVGRKNRKPLKELVFSEHFGEPFEPKQSYG
jgi:nitroreductase